jgi:hypothetical protein
MFYQQQTAEIIETGSPGFYDDDAGYMPLSQSEFAVLATRTLLRSQQGRRNQMRTKSANVRRSGEKC